MRHLIRAKARAVVHDCEVSRRDGTNGDGHRDDVEIVPRPACYAVVEYCAGHRVAQGPVPKVELKQKDIKIIQLQSRFEFPTCSFGCP